jgi:hypothetical protein
LTGDKLPALNKELRSRKLAEIKVISENDWQAAHQDDASSAPPSGMMRERD